MGLSGDGGYVVSAPVCEPWPGGLLSVAELETHGDNLWAKGLEFEDEACVTGAVKALSGQCPTLDEPQRKGTVHGLDFEYMDPFWLYTGFDCSTGGLVVSEAWDHADQLYERHYRWALERAFWTGRDQDGNGFRMSLAMGPSGDPADVVDVNPAGALPVVKAVTALEEYMSDLSCLPTLHASVGLVNVFATAMLAPGTPSERRTPAGSKIAFGAGYPKTGPNNAEPGAGEAWVFATGPAKVVKGVKDFVPARDSWPQAIERTLNNVIILVEQPWSTMYACGIAAVRVTL